jgi:hypothetical protein
MDLIAFDPRYSLGDFFSEAASMIDQAFFMAASATFKVWLATSVTVFAVVSSDMFFGLLLSHCC